MAVEPGKEPSMVGFLLGGRLCVMHRMARRRVVRIMRKHGLWPVRSYGLREVHSPNLGEGVFSEVRYPLATSR